MKKVLSVLCLFLFSLVFPTGCSKEHFEDEAKLITRTGVLIQQSGTDSLAGTHVLKANGDSIASRSLSINLSDSKFLNNKVEALGFINDKDGVFEITGVTVVDKLSEVDNKISLTEYKNSQWGFELKYFDNWKITSSDLEIVFSLSNSEEKVTISRDPFDYATDADPETLDNPLAYYFRLFDDEKRIEDISPYINYVGIDKVSAVKISGKDQEIYYLYRPGFIYIIRYEDPRGEAANKLNFANMLAEFRFIPFGENETVEKTDNSLVKDVPKVMSMNDADFSSFESLPYHFKGKYPKNWYYAGASSRKDFVLHHYSFSTESVTDDNEIIGLSVTAFDLPKEKALNFSGKDLVVVEQGSSLQVFVEVGDYVYVVSGLPEYRDLMIFMAESIEDTTVYS